MANPLSLYQPLQFLEHGPSIIRLAKFSNLVPPFSRISELGAGQIKIGPILGASF
jgi:hypothetical protein